MVRSKADKTIPQELQNRGPGKSRFRAALLRDWQLYILALPAIAAIFIFSYMPMYGVVIAFKNFKPAYTIWGSEWVGFNNFIRFFQSSQFRNIIPNTLILSVYGLFLGIPIPILLALLLNQTSNQKFKRTVQTVTYAPHFISTVVLVGMLNLFLSPNGGLLNQLLALFNIEPKFFMGLPQYFRHVYVFSGIWQNAGWGAIIYLAALAGIDPMLYEAARVDGANRFHLIRHIDIPGIMPTIVILLILDLATIMSVGFDKTYLMQNILNVSTSEVISTYVYKIGISASRTPQFSYASAIGLFNTVINFIMLLVVNRISRAVSETSLW